MNHKSQLIKAQDYEKQQTAIKFELAKKIGTTAGFYQYYFDTLPNFNCCNECFVNVNDLHYSVFKEYKYASYSNFMRRIYNQNKKKQ